MPAGLSIGGAVAFESSGAGAATDGERGGGKGSVTTGDEEAPAPRAICFPHLPQKAAVFLTAAPQCGQGSSSAIGATATATAAGAISSRAKGGIACFAGGLCITSIGAEFCELMLKSLPHLGQNLASGLQAN